MNKAPLFFRTLLLLFSIFFSFSFSSLSQNFNEKLLLDGVVPLYAYGLDTTGHWWAVTQPFQGKYRVIVDGEESSTYDDISPIKFSPNGINWCFFGNASNNIYLVDDSSDNLFEDATDFGEITFSPNGDYRAFSYFRAGIEVIHLPNRKIEVENRVGKLFIDNSGTRFALVGRRLDVFVLNVNGKESSTYDEIIPIGFWHTGEFIYAARNGFFWEVYQGDKSLGESYSKIVSYKINTFGTVLALLVRLNTGQNMSLLFSDEYREPIYGKTYDEVWGLALHPELPLIGYAAGDKYRDYVIQNSTEYYAPGAFSDPFYTHDGEELLFVGVGNFNPYISINGRNYDIFIGLTEETQVAKKPKHPTFAYSTRTTLLVHYYEKNEYYTGYMTDETSETIWNWRKGEYQTLGAIHDRLYLISCKL